ncbi:uncharacterized protein LAESUDRAFT_655151, partial [Laetiporus sulphureus 93-53]
HDPGIYADPFAFNPDSDRFLISGNRNLEPDFREVLWGFGRWEMLSLYEGGGQIKKHTLPVYAQVRRDYSNRIPDVGH